MIDLAAVNDLILSFLCVDKLQVFAVRVNNQTGMWIKSHHHRFTATPPGLFIHISKDLLVTNMYTVERTNAYHRIGYRLKKIYTVVNLHNNINTK